LIILKLSCPQGLGSTHIQLNTFNQNSLRYFREKIAGTEKKRLGIKTMLCVVHAISSIPFSVAYHITTENYLIVYSRKPAR
jgi:hypothetical protein